MEKKTSMHQDSEEAHRKKLGAASMSIAANAFLIAMKLAVTVLTGSIALLAELVHSLFDMLASLLAYIGIRKASQPADVSHHYGHEKFENLSSFAQTVLIFITSLLIITEAWSRFFVQKEIRATELGLIAMIITVVVDFCVSRYLHRASSRYKSTALEADAYHFTTDLWSAVAVIVGLGFVAAGFPVFDSIAAVAVALLMIWVSFRLGRKSINVLMDSSPSPQEMEKIGKIIRSVKGVRSFHKLRARHAGRRLIIDLHIQVSPQLSIKKGHEIAHKVKRRLTEEMPEVKEVTIHTEPHEKSPVAD